MNILQLQNKVKIQGHRDHACVCSIFNEHVTLCQAWRSLWGDINIVKKRSAPVTMTRILPSFTSYLDLTHQTGNTAKYTRKCKSLQTLVHV